MKINSCKDIEKKFSFQYCIDLGKGRFGSMLINEKSDLYKEAQTFCQNYSLDSSIVPILQQQLFQEILNMKSNMEADFREQKQNQITPEDPSIPSLLKQSNKKTKVHQTCQRSAGKKINIKTVNNLTDKKNKIDNLVNGPKKTITNHYEQLYQQYQQIQAKKQLQRKASLQKIPFQPSINRLSRKIVEQKRRSKGSLSSSLCSSQIKMKKINENFKIFKREGTSKKKILRPQ